jgi:hypothetical protein
MGDLVKLKVDVDGPLRGIRMLKDEQLPFTIARSLTMTAQDAQKTVRGVERFVFQLRNDWTVQNTKITPATKQTLMAEVYTDTGNRKTGAPDYLPPQESGGEKVPVGGHQFLAIPTRYLYKYTSRNRPIPDNLRPKALLPPDAQAGVRYSGGFVAGRGEGIKRAIGKATMKRLKTGEFEAFVQTAKSGTVCIFVKHGGLGFSGAQDAEPWYILVREAHIRPRFPITEIVTQVVDKTFSANFTRAAAEVGVNDALRGTGLSVKF